MLKFVPIACHYIALVIMLLLNSCNRDQPPPYSQDLPAEAYTLIQSGDLILRAGRGPLSGAIMKGLRETRSFSHVGILFLDDDQWQVWHTVSSDYGPQDGVQIDYLQHWLTEARQDEYYISRHRDGKTAEFLTAAQALLLAKIPFDAGFDFADSSRMYCTEYIYHALRDAGLEAPQPEMLNSGVVGIDFEPFWNSELFEPVYDPLATVE